MEMKVQTVPTAPVITEDSNEALAQPDSTEENWGVERNDVDSGHLLEKR